ncbi:hypothetical protein BKA69DRAFT_623985 [Paraphysoderma sedebokerense]|nr:hypothetical protein BKA69DRAFT_623985 [Paraphysoderma sedebokerense]
MPHPTILSTARQSQLGETLATNNYTKAYIEPLLASSNDLNTFSQRCKAALANTVIPSKNPKEQAVPTVMKDQGQSNALIEQVKNCAIQSLGVVGNQIQKSMEGLEAWCKLVSDEIEWEAKEMQFITERLSSSREIVGRKGAGDLIAAQSTPLPPKIQQLSEPVKTLTPSSLSLNLDALSTIGTQLPQSLLGPNGMFGNQATTISRTDDSSRRSFTSTIAAAAKIPEIVSPLSEEVDVPPPPPPDEGMSDFPPPPSNYGDIPPPSDFGDIPRMPCFHVFLKYSFITDRLI